jgi:hypothetical protein
MCCKLVRKGGDGKISAEYATVETSQHYRLSFAPAYLSIYLTVYLCVCLSIYLSICLSMHPCMVQYVLGMVLIVAILSISSSVGGRRERIDEKVEILRVGERHLLQGGKDPHDALSLSLLFT